MNSARPLNLVSVLLILVSPPGKVYWPLLKLSPFGFSRDTVNFTRDATNLSGSLTKFSDPAINFDNFDKPRFYRIGYRIIDTHPADERIRYIFQTIAASAWQFSLAL